MIGLGSGGGSGDNSVDALANLLKVVSDPAASKARLDALAAKNAEANETLQKIVVLNKDTDNKQIEIANAQAKLEADQAKLATKENDVNARIAKLAADLNDFTAREQAYLMDKKRFEEETAAKTADLTKLAGDLAKAEQDNTLKLNNAVSEIAKTLADQKTALEAEYKDRLATADFLKAEASKDRDAAAASFAKAEEQRVFYEGRVSALQKAMQGTA